MKIHAWKFSQCMHEVLSCMYEMYYQLSFASCVLDGQLLFIRHSFLMSFWRDIYEHFFQNKYQVKHVRIINYHVIYVGMFHVINGKQRQERSCDKLQAIYHMSKIFKKVKNSWKFVEIVNKVVKSNHFIFFWHLYVFNLCVLCLKLRMDN